MRFGYGAGGAGTAAARSVAAGAADQAGAVDRGDVEAGALGNLLEVDLRAGRVRERHLGEQLAGPQVDMLVAAVELSERNGAAAVAGGASATLASRASSRAVKSPIGEALTTLPASVARLRICQEAIR